MKPTSEGLKQLLERHGFTPTGESKKDIQKAREFMPPGYTLKQKELDDYE